MDYSEVDEDDEDLYEGLEADNLLQGSYEKRIEEKKKEVERAPVVKPKEQLFEKSRKSLYKKLSGAKAVYTKKEPCLFLGAPQLSEDAEEEEDNKVEFLLLVNLLYFINDVVIKNCCDKIGKVKRVVILEDDKHGKSLGIGLVEFYSIDSSQNYVAYLKEKLKADVRKLSLDIEEQIKADDLYNYGGYINSHTVELIKRDNLDVLQCTENIHDALSKSLNLNKHPIFSWFNTSMKDVLSTYVKSEIKKKKKTPS
ncbi:hypothetical protein AK88_02148 [Plasmodium fragile]|uniref:RRM domain-containing protein n=1 Tax=Plasmodium fragile TaxID=5857 RepID=A0A0D9QR98_PLAFR|nr:uncharacterized protein AK88_02148 [Plasmodium fragile]KJP88201.1 hypothetical protein AK88_02148 [Plasmodium fragile]